MEQNFKAFDELRKMGYLIGEMIWNFADFATPQGKTATNVIFYYYFCWLGMEMLEGRMYVLGA